MIVLLFNIQYQSKVWTHFPIYIYIYYFFYTLIIAKYAINIFTDITTFGNSKYKKTLSMFSLWLGVRLCEGHLVCIDM